LPSAAESPEGDSARGVAKHVATLRAALTDGDFQDADAALLDGQAGGGVPMERLRNLLETLVE